MNTPNFASILDDSPTEVKAPPPMPVGTYLCTIVGSAEYGKAPQTGTDFAKFVLKPIQAADDVNEEELSEIGGFDGKTLRATFWLTPDAVFMLDQFHEACGIDLDDGASRRTRNDAVVNRQVYAKVKHTASRDGKRIMAEIAGYAVAD